ncbi:hypothetical protein IJF86_01045 [Candidatus Saccharibacteria bacterium]|nr:hypothetical protein [Candidatus Saccharibacteria bacterium]
MFKKVLKVFVISVGLLALVFSFSAVAKGLQKRPEQFDYDYFRIEKEATSVVITGRPNVRSEPIVVDDYASLFVDTTSYGRVSESSVEVKVSKIFLEQKTEYWSRPLDQSNGYFIGVLVRDIENIEDWEQLFPKGITKDPDGIVWINCDYIRAQ